MFKFSIVLKKDKPKVKKYYYDINLACNRCNKKFFLWEEVDKGGEFFYINLPDVLKEVQKQALHIYTQPVSYMFYCVSCNKKLVFIKKLKRFISSIIPWHRSC